jgi:hypothetical protein
MKTVAKISSEPTAIDVSVTITMSLAEWKRLYDQLPGQWPANFVALSIREVVDKITAQVEADEVRGP